MYRALRSTLPALALTFTLACAEKDNSPSQVIPPPVPLTPQQQLEKDLADCHKKYEVQSAALENISRQLAPAMALRDTAAQLTNIARQIRFTEYQTLEECSRVGTAARASLKTAREGLTGTPALAYQNQLFEIDKGLMKIEREYAYRYPSAPK